MAAVVSAAITVLLNFIAMCPSDKRLRLYASGAAKKPREESSTGQCGGRHEYIPELTFRNHHTERRRQNQHHVEQ